MRNWPVRRKANKPTEKRSNNLCASSPGSKIVRKTTAATGIERSRRWLCLGIRNRSCAGSDDGRFGPARSSARRLGESLTASTLPDQLAPASLPEFPRDENAVCDERFIGHAAIVKKRIRHFVGT